MASKSISKLVITIRIISFCIVSCVSAPSLAFWPWDMVREFFHDFFEEDTPEKISFENANLESKDQHNVHYESINFKNAKMYRANFQNAQIRNSNFQNVDMRETNFINASLPISNFFNANLTRSNFKGANLEISHINSAKIIFVNFEGANLAHVQMNNSDIRKSDFRNTLLENASFLSSDIYKASFERARIILTNFQGSAMESNSFQDTEIQGAQFQGVNLRESNFRSSYIHPEKIVAPQHSYTPFGCIPGILRAKIHRDDPDKIVKKSDEKWNKIDNKMINNSTSIVPEACTNFEEASFKDAILFNVNFSNPHHFRYSNLSVNQLCQAQSLYQSTFPDFIIKAIKKDKACAKKLTDKMLYEQARTDFFNNQKNTGDRNRS